ncbi:MULTISPECIES: LysR family transcriptional regulator [Alphaproteobacteria]|jgi:DNA-binding transcriptional LysR family regulator|uniref:HTH-type transcriptional regulator DmlR n=2 Tax=Alphaproteobacteria TaxID=28211 RepID=A0A1X6YLU7_9RHOB|nr:MULTISPECIES: LysR family transcriptional regulator [Alphaproteobacteria]KCZ48567.1 transcriptional regulator [Hyphomonas pacifica]RAN31575.1 transcriptional regulator [Hyphomonas pacifica]RKT34338.1 DNA-binding transcriptional LysR family regulator [Roseovarius halotolerans]SLN24784.1 HTH-type transcriptional regulator DmlR [Roseovarius halotolerans]|tara:strand:- start:57 stop:965 length:909 start_codon:yes stop_codon:yes gene_type:complete
MDPRKFSDLVIFNRVAEERSFTAAARSLGVTQSAVSQTVKRLEADLGIRLLSRSTRSIAPTAAGERLLATLAPVIAEIDAEIDDLEQLREEPGGRLRVTCGKHAADTLVWPAFSRLIAAHPEIDGELSVENRHVDIVAERFDVGIRLREDLEMDMVAVPVGPHLRAVVVGAPRYLDSCDPPHTPRDVSAHRCIGFRNAGGTLSPWSFEKDGHAETVKVSPSLIVNDGDALVGAASAGMGLAYMLEDLAAPFLNDGLLVEVLADWCPPFPGYHAFYSSRRHPTRAFTLFLESLRAETSATTSK